MRFRLVGLLLMLMSLVGSRWAYGQDAPPAAGPPAIDVRQLFEDGGTIGYLIVALSLAMVALIFEHLFSLRRGALMPSGLAEEVYRQIMQGQFKTAEEACRARPSFLAYVLGAGLREVNIGYASVEKAMEDAAAQQAARLQRKVEYLSVVGSLAPMLGLMGTVWGMIIAFMEFERKANPQVSELAPGVYKALVTTLFGLTVAIPALAAYAYFRNRVDELVAQTSLMAEHVFADYKRSEATRRKMQRAERKTARKPPVAPPNSGREGPR